MKVNDLQLNKQSRVFQSKPKSSKSLIQKRAWVASRPLGQVASIGPLTQVQQQNVRFNPLNLPTDQGNIDSNHVLHHRHIVFSEPKNLPIGLSDNIGFHCADNRLFGKGELFHEDWKRFGYTPLIMLSNSIEDDNILALSIHRNSVVDNYNILTNNCQHWVEKVRNKYAELHAIHH